MKIPSDQVTSFCALIVAAFALFLTIYEGCATRKHNKLSVKPIMFVSFEFNEEGTGWLALNSGVGPGVLKWLEVKVDGKPARTWNDILPALGVSDCFEYTFATTSGNVLNPGETKRVFWLEPKSPAERSLREGMGRLRIRYCFCSIYDECWLNIGTMENVAGAFM